MTCKRFTSEKQINRKPQCLMETRILHDGVLPQPQNTLPELENQGEIPLKPEQKTTLLAEGLV